MQGPKLYRPPGTELGPPPPLPRFVIGSRQNFLRPTAVPGGEGEEGGGRERGSLSCEGGMQGMRLRARRGYIISGFHSHSFSSRQLTKSTTCLDVAREAR